MNKQLIIRSLNYLMLSTLFLVGCKSNETKKIEGRVQYSIPDSLFKTLIIDTVSSCPLANAITLTGKVSSNDDNVVKVYPMVSGNVQDIKVVLGDYVNAGQILAVIKSSEMAGFSNDLVNAESNIRIASKNLDKTKDLYKSGLASLTDSLSAEITLQQAKSELNRVNRVLKINGGNTQGAYIIKAPISGFIVEKFVTNNMTIRADNSTNLFTISDLKNVWVMANVYESSINKVHLGDQVNVTTLSYPDRIFTGKVDKVFNVLDPTNKVMKIRIILSNSDYALKPEMFTSVTVFNKENKISICISAKALIFDHSQYFVLVCDSKRHVTITPVQPISTLGDKAYILSGVSLGQQIVASQALLIYDQANN